MVHSVLTKPQEEKRRRCEAALPHVKNTKAHCFNWPDGEPTILFVRDKRGEYSARIQNVEHGCSLWGTRSTHGAKKSLKGRFPDEESEAGARCTNQIPWTA